jgi:hypothetical protein
MNASSVVVLCIVLAGAGVLIIGAIIFLHTRRRGGTEQLDYQERRGLQANYLREVRERNQDNMAAAYGFAYPGYGHSQSAPKYPQYAHYNVTQSSLPTPLSA